MLPLASSGGGSRRNGVTAHHFFSRSLACLVRVLLVQLLPACLVLALAQVAGAATSLPRVSGSLDGKDAPICDPSGASAPAPADIPEVDRGRVEELPCEALDDVFAATLRDRSRGAVAAAPSRDGSHVPDGVAIERSRFEGAPLVAIRFPERARPALLPFVTVESLARQRGHRSPLYRPPLPAAG